MRELTDAQQHLLWSIDLVGGQYSIGFTPTAESLRRKGYILRVTRDSVILTDAGRALLAEARDA